MLADVDPVGIAAEFSPWRRVLEVVAAIMFRHPGAFNEGAQERVVVGFAESFPTVDFVVKANQFTPISDRLQGFGVYLMPIQGAVVAGPVVEIESAIIV